MKRSTQIITSATVGIIIGGLIRKLLQYSPEKKIARRQRQLDKAIDNKLRSDKSSLEEIKRSLEEQINRINEQLNETNEIGPGHKPDRNHIHS